MKSRLLFFFLSAWISLTQAADLPDWQNAPPEPAERVGGVLDTASNQWLSPTELVKRLTPSQQILLGEKHDNPDHHRLQLWLLEQLQSQIPRAALVMEMLTQAQQPMVDALQASAEQLTGQPLADSLDWSEGWDWPMYQPIVEWALRNGVPLRAANLEWEEIRELYRNPAPLSPRYSDQVRREMEQIIEESHCGKLPDDQLASMLTIQQERDIRMAKSLAKAPVPAVLIAGNYHVRKDLGLPLHLDGITPVVVMLHEVGTPLPGAAQADYVWLTPAIPEQDYCAQFQ